MAESQIAAIYLAISKLKIGKIKCRNITKIKLEIRDKDLPCRFLLPATEGELNFVALGASPVSVKWVIRDLCLWAPISKGSGIEKFSKAMLEHEMLYIKRLQEGMHPTTQSVVTSVSWRQGPVPWAKKDYWAIDYTLTVTEII